MTDRVFSTDWRRAPAPPRIRENEIHVWRAQLDPEQALLPGLEAILAPEEKSRAGRFVFPRDRVHFVAAHGILRIILASYLRMPAKDVMFRYGPQKKPAIGLDHSESTVRFSLSHSHGLAVCAVARGREVGVDVEAIRPEVAGEDIAERFFSPRERAELRLLPPDRRVEGFFLCWTLKEAYIKARSVGLGIPLDSFDVSLMPGQPKGLISPDSDRWTLRSFQPAPGYAGAVVGEGKNWELRYWDWNLGHDFINTATYSAAGRKEISRV